MSIAEALQITGIRKDELNRINITALDSVIKGEEKQASIFPYDDTIKRRIKAYNTIRKEVSK